ncbi:hypothetical protein [Candidatus Berkiella aquae]|nr:hypothetical protein [Candidatus Berkiella aquae]
MFEKQVGDFYLNQRYPSLNDATFITVTICLENPRGSEEIR